MLTNIYLLKLSDRIICSSDSKVVLSKLIKKLKKDLGDIEEKFEIPVVKINPLLKQEDFIEMSKYNIPKNDNKIFLSKKQKKKPFGFFLLILT